MSTLDLSMCYGHIDTNQDCCVPYHSSSGTICIWKIAWSGGGQSVAEMWSGGGQSVAETCTSRASHVYDNRDHYIIFIPMEIIHSDERHE